MRERPKKRIGRPPLPTYGYRRVQAILKRQALAASLKPPNHKRVYRVMKVHGPLLDRDAGGVERRHDGRIAVDARNRRWCSDGFEISRQVASGMPQNGTHIVSKRLGSRYRSGRSTDWLKFKNPHARGSMHRSDSFAVTGALFLACSLRAA
jgi:transposase InsO family protein